MLRRTLLVSALAAGSLAATLVATGAGGSAGAATPTQFTFFSDQRVVNDVDQYATPLWTAPGNWLSPVDYANGRMFMRVRILDKPSSRSVDVKLCMWEHSLGKWKREVCAKGFSATDETTLWLDLGQPTRWYDRDNLWDWRVNPSKVRVLILDTATKLLMNEKICDPYCYKGTDLRQHVPIVMEAGAIVVAKGATLQAPPSWKGCPAEWSPTCPGGTGSTSSTNATTSTTSGSTSSTNATTSTTSRSSSTTAASTTSTSRQPASKKAALITGNAASVPSADRAVRTRLQGLGYTVTAVDDDGLTSGQLTGHDVVVVSSSVLPSKIPTWLATLAVPVVNAEGYAHSRLRIASSGGEVAGQTAVNVVTSTHPIAGGLSGTQAVHTKALPVSSATPAPGAVTVARVPSSTKATVFAIDKGRALTSGTAPARRVGIHFSYASPTASTTNGWALFDRAVIWADG